MKGKSFFSKRTISNLIVVCVGILLFLALYNFGAIRQFAGWLFRIFSPFVAAIGIAYVLNMPMRFFERKVYRKLRIRRGLSVLTVYLLAMLIIGMVLGLVLPQVATSLLALGRSVPRYLDNLSGFAAWLAETFSLETDSLDFVLISYQDILAKILDWVRTSLPNLVGITMQVGSGLVGALTAIIASIYMLLSRDKLLRQCKRAIYAILPTARADGVLRVGRLSNEVFSGFISGKLLDSAIIGLLCFVFMAVMNAWIIPMPFALLISIVVGLTNIIPFFGPFIGAIPSIMILLLVNPWSALWFTIFIILLQQFDGNILGPKILGDSTGLPALWVLVAIIVGGGFFGFSGMLLGVPTAAVLYTLFADWTARRLAKKGISTEKTEIVPYAKSHKIFSSNTGVTAALPATESSITNVAPMDAALPADHSTPKDAAADKDHPGK